MDLAESSAENAPSHPRGAPPPPQRQHSHPGFVHPGEHPLSLPPQSSAAAYAHRPTQQSGGAPSSKPHILLSRQCLDPAGTTAEQTQTHQRVVVPVAALPESRGIDLSAIYPPIPFIYGGMLILCLVLFPLGNLPYSPLDPLASNYYAAFCGFYSTRAKWLAAILQILATLAMVGGMIDFPEIRKTSYCVFLALLLGSYVCTAAMFRIDDQMWDSAVFGNGAFGASSTWFVTAEGLENRAVYALLNQWRILNIARAVLGIASAVLYGVRGQFDSWFGFNNNGLFGLMPWQEMVEVEKGRRGSYPGLAAGPAAGPMARARAREVNRGTVGIEMR